MVRLSIDIPIPDLRIILRRVTVPHLDYQAKPAPGALNHGSLDHRTQSLGDNSGDKIDATQVQVAPNSLVFKREIEKWARKKTKHRAQTNAL